MAVCLIYTTQTKESEMIISSLKYGLLKCPIDWDVWEYANNLGLDKASYARTWWVYGSMDEYKESLD